MSETTATPSMPGLRDLASCAAASRRTVAEFALSGFEQTVDNLIAYERWVAETIPLDWLKEVVVIRTAVMDEMKTSVVRAARAAIG